MKRIVSVGCEIPGGDIEYYELSARNSLLDADIIIFMPGMPKHYDPDNTIYSGEYCFTDNASAKAIKDMQHWREELAAAVHAGKFIMMFLAAPKSFYVSTGQKKTSGTGRNQKTTTIVREANSYEMVPTKVEYFAATGERMKSVSKESYFSAYWNNFGAESFYEAYVKGDNITPLATTASGERVVSYAIKKAEGMFLAVPCLNLDDKRFVEEVVVDGLKGLHWSDEAVKFQNRLTTTLVGIADAVSKSNLKSPAPTWTEAAEFALPLEVTLLKRASEIENQLSSLLAAKAKLGSDLAEARVLRDLLFEQGKPLEHAVRKALQLMGFQAAGYDDGESEFDVIFNSPEGRFLGEAEGRDTKSINIAKMSQLERNLAEDFQRDEIEE
jgi:hypothetical protein